MQITTTISEDIGLSEDGKKRAAIAFQMVLIVDTMKELGMSKREAAERVSNMFNAALR